MLRPLISKLGHHRSRAGAFSRSLLRAAKLSHLLPALFLFADDWVPLRDLFSSLDQGNVSTHTESKAAGQHRSKDDRWYVIAFEEIAAPYRFKGGVTIGARTLLSDY